MIEQISSFFNIEMIYLWLNFGVLPFWITLIFFPQSRTCSYLVTSVFPFFLLSLIYSYLLYLFFMNGYDFSSNFSLYLSLENLSTLFTENAFFKISLWLANSMPCLNLPPEPIIPVSLTCGTTFFFLKNENIYLRRLSKLITANN